LAALGIGQHDVRHVMQGRSQRPLERATSLQRLGFWQLRLAAVVKGYSMPAIGHRNVTVPLRVLAGVE
jgi:hypothetical protein